VPVSQNGYTANDTSALDTYTVPGSRVRLRLRKGPPATVLLYLASRFDDEVEDIDTAGTYIQDAAPSIPGGEPSTLADDWSYAPRPIRGSTTTLSNHASGTAIDLNATQHPRGSARTFTAEQTRRVRAILASLRDPLTGRPVVRWGQDYVSAPTDGMHFEVDADPAAVARVAHHITAAAAPTPLPEEAPMIVIRREKGWWYLALGGKLVGLYAGQKIDKTIPRITVDEKQWTRLAQAVEVVM